MFDSALIAEKPGTELSFLWLELTSRCNLSCVHCYSESSPSVTKDALGADDYSRVIEVASSLGCIRLQFIGGEPTLHPALPNLIALARRCGYQFVEVFTNATRVSESLLGCFVREKVAVATSFYSHDPAIHDAITKRPGSHSETVKHIKRFLRVGLDLRVGIITMEENANTLVETKEFLKNLGVTNVGSDRVRGFGRGTDVVRLQQPNLTELCGSCWRGSVCVSPEGTVYPCIMARSWPIGSVLQSSLASILASQSLQAIREEIYNRIWLPKQRPEQTVAASCGPECVPMCSPTCSPSCNPCYPQGRCNPELYCGPCGPAR